MEDKEDNSLALPVRQFTANDTKLVILYPSGYTIAAGIISDGTMQKKKMLGESVDYITLERYYIDMFKGRTYDVIRDIVKDINITSVDIYTEDDGLYDSYNMLKALENYNDEIGRNQINLNGVAIFRNNKGIFSVYQADRLANICTIVGDIARTIERDNKDIIEYEDGHIEIKIEEITYYSIPYTEMECYSTLWGTTENILLALGLRSIHAAEKEFRIDTPHGIAMDSLITAVHKYVSNNIEHQLEADLGYKFAYWFDFNYWFEYEKESIAVYGLKPFKVSRKNIEDLIKAYAEEYFKQVELDRISIANKQADETEKQAEEEEEEENIKSADYIEYYNGTGPLADDGSLPNLYIYDAQLILILEIIKDFYNKGIYMSFDLRKLEYAYIQESKFTYYQNKASRFTEGVDIDKFVTTNLNIDIDKEVENAINRLKEAAVYVFNHRKEEEWQLLNNFYPFLNEGRSEEKE